MAKNLTKDHVLSRLKNLERPISSQELSELLGGAVTDRTLRRWLGQLVDSGQVIRSGQKRGTRYQIKSQDPHPCLGFLNPFSEERQAQILAELKALWTHTSTSIEGNTLTLGETRDYLSFGLTIGGKSLKEHQEIDGHAKAIDLLYELVNNELSVERLFELHNAVQIEVVRDIYKPIGNWKVEPNGTYVLSDEGKQVYLEYAHPFEVKGLVVELLEELTKPEYYNLTQEDAPRAYALFHAGFAHIHPFFDGNGRLARLVANLPLLRSGLPPIVIDASKRRDYISLLAKYEMSVGTISRKTGVWPERGLLKAFEMFCADNYQASLDILAS